MEYKKNDIVTVSIEDIGNDGEGIGKVEGYTLFVKDAVIGDVVEARITKCKKNYGYAKVEKVVTPSSFRVEPKCPYHRQCGGCQIQAMSYERQLIYKQDKIRSNLLRIGGFAPEKIDAVMEPIVGMEEPWHYRNKAQFPVGYDREGNLVTGFYAGRTHDIIANTDCVLGAPENKLILEAILSYMRENHVTAYRESTGKGLIRHVLIRTGFMSGEIMVCLVVNGTKLPMEEKLVEKLRGISLAGTGESGRDKKITSISISINKEKTNVIMGQDIRVLWGSRYIQDTLCGLNFSISPLSFYQVNPRQTEKLYGIALEYARLTGNETVWDLYCGIGTISLCMAKKAKQVYGVEVVQQAIEDARENACANQIGNVEFYEGKAEEVLPAFYEKEALREQAQGAFGERIESRRGDKFHPDVIVVDPPRKGCDEKCLETMLKMQPERIVYVSCDSATLARDLKVLCEGGYELQRLRGVDQFGGTVHVETCVLLSKLKSTQHIKVEIDLDEMDLTKAESKATYAEIKQYVLEKYDLKVSQLYIAQVKRKHGIIERINYNTGEGKARVPKVPLEKEKAIEDALKYFQMI